MTPLHSATVGRLGVCGLLFVQVDGEEAHDLVVTEFFCAYDQRPVTADFAALGGLRVRDDGGVQYGLVFDLAAVSSASLMMPIDGMALRPAGLLAELLKHPLKPLDLLVGLFEMTFQSGDVVAFSIVLASDLMICCSA